MTEYDRRQYEGMTIEQKIDAIFLIVHKLQDAFPEGPEKHREAHEAWIKAKQAETQFWVELKLDLAKKSVRGLIMLVLGLIAVGLTTKSGVWFH